MTQIETILAEIERRYRENKAELEKLPMYCDEASLLRRMCKEDLYFRDFINSLPAEQPGEELEEAAKEYVKENCILPEDCNDGDNPYYEKCTAAVFKDGAQWQKDKLLNKACKWLNKNVVEYHPRKGELRPIVNINAFREAMEKEDEQCSTE